MRKYTFFIILAIFVVCGTSIAFAQDKDTQEPSNQPQVVTPNSGTSNQPTPAEKEDWIKYVTWEGDVDELLILRITNEEVKVDYPVGAGVKNAKATFFAGEPRSEAAAKIEVETGRGTVAIRKQYWQRPNNDFNVQIYDKDSGFGHYKFTVFYLEKNFTPKEKRVYQDIVDKTVFDYDVYFMRKAIEKDDLIDALRFARNAYEIDRLNWEILNIMGMLYYKTNVMDKAEDVFVILRDNGYLTEDNKKRFKEISPYQFSKMEASEKEGTETEEGDQEENTDAGSTENSGDNSSDNK